MLEQHDEELFMISERAFVPNKVSVCEENVGVQLAITIYETINPQMVIGAFRDSYVHIVSVRC